MGTQHHYPRIATVLMHIHTYTHRYFMVLRTFTMGFGSIPHRCAIHCQYTRPSDITHYVVALDTDVRCYITDYRLRVTLVFVVRYHPAH